MNIIKELRNTIDFEEVQEIYNKGNKIGMENNYSLNIGFVDRVHVDKDTIVDLTNEDLDIIEGLEILNNYEIVLKGNSIVEFDSIYWDSREREYVALIKPFKGIHRDKLLPIFLYNNSGVIGNRVYEIEG